MKSFGEFNEKLFAGSPIISVEKLGILWKKLALCPNLINLSQKPVSNERRFKSWNIECGTNHIWAATQI